MVDGTVAEGQAYDGTVPFKLRRGLGRQLSASNSRIEPHAQWRGEPQSIQSSTSSEGQKQSYAETIPGILSARRGGLAKTGNPATGSACEVSGPISSSWNHASEEVADTITGPEERLRPKSAKRDIDKTTIILQEDGFTCAATT